MIHEEKKSSSSHLLQEVLQQSIELVYELIEELRSGDVHAVEDGELFVAEIVVGGRAGLQDFSVCVLILNLPDLPQQGIQMLEVKVKAHIIVSLALHIGHKVTKPEKKNKKIDKPFLTGQLCRCQDQSTLVFVTNWSPYQYQRSTMTRKRMNS